MSKLYKRNFVSHINPIIFVNEIHYCGYLQVSGDFRRQYKLVATVQKIN